MPLPTDPQIAVIVEQLGNVRTDIATLRADLRTHQTVYLPRTEFEAWKTGIDREVRDVKATQSKAPVWPSIVSGVVAAIALGITLITGLGGA